eukprot:TRINITY_DN5529_c0_g1_i1.p1 TRINITY_DN5529_c0_g1~~TRINITY_DN5529_c0_g1_i1.p1  ORF type:complete len:370 (+),score=57.87 TRINITY_DN5529_c0_g1_i1:125-1111(+)
MSLGELVRQGGLSVGYPVVGALGSHFGQAASIGLIRWKSSVAQESAPATTQPTKTSTGVDHWEQQEVNQKPTDYPKPHLHPSLLRQEKGSDYLLMHPVYDANYLCQVKPRHIAPQNVTDKVAFHAIQSTRTIFDYVTGYGPKMNEQQWLRRIIFLETVAGVPGMVGGMLRHLRSLRTMRRDHGWIHTLLEEAENERMHLLTFLKLREPGPLFRGFVILTQGIFFNTFFLAYLVSPTLCHRMVGYLEEEAIKTYSHCLHDIETGQLGWAELPAPPIAIEYWKLPADASMRDVVLAVRADEACHSHVNHTFASMGPKDTNPFSPGSHMVP